MQVSVETTSGLERRMTIAVPGDRIESEVEKRLKSMAPRVKLSGFRPGKVPFSVVKKRYSGQVRQEVLGELVNSSFYEAVAKEKLRPAGMPTIEKQSDTDDQGVEYTARFEIYPEIEVKGVEKLAIQRESAEVAASDIDVMVNKLREQRTEFKAVERASKKGDRVTVDYDATVNGESFEGGNGKGLSVVLGSGRMIAGFEEGLVGTKAGEVKELDLTFPDPYHNADIAGKPVHFSVTITTVEEPALPEVDAEFVKAFGIEDGDVEKLRDELKKNMQRELGQVIRSNLKNQVMDKLLAANEFEIPGSLVSAEAQRMAKQMTEQLRSQGMQGGQFGQLTGDMYKDQAKKRVALGMILAEIIQKNGIKASPDKIRAEVEKIASAYNDPQEVVSWYYQDRQRLQEIESMVMEDQVVEWVLESAQVTDNMKTFDELMNPTQK